MTDNFKVRFLSALWEDYLYNDSFKDTVIYKHIYEKEYNRALQCEKSGKAGTSDLSRLILIYKGCTRGDFFLKLIELLSTSPKTFFEKKTTPGRDAELQETLLDELFRFFNEGAVQKNIFDPKDVPSLAVPVKESISGTRKLKAFIKSLHRDLSSLSKRKQESIGKKIDELEEIYPFMKEIYETLMCIGIQHKFISEFLYNYGVTIAEEEYEIKIVKPEDDDEAEEIEESRPILVFNNANNSRKKDDTLGLITSCFEDPVFHQKLFPGSSSKADQNLDKLKKVWLDHYNRYIEDKKDPKFYVSKYLNYKADIILLTINPETGVGFFILGCDHFRDEITHDKDSHPLPFLPATLSFHDYIDDGANDFFAKCAYAVNKEYNGYSVLSKNEISDLISTQRPEQIKQILAEYYQKYKEAIKEAENMLLS